MIATWILIVYLSGYKHGGPAVVPGFATEADCRAAAVQIKATFADIYDAGVCVRQPAREARKAPQ